MWYPRPAARCLCSRPCCVPTPHTSFPFLSHGIHEELSSVFRTQEKENKEGKERGTSLLLPSGCSQGSSGSSSGSGRIWWHKQLPPNVRVLAKPVGRHRGTPNSKRTKLDTEKIQARQVHVHTHDKPRVKAQQLRHSPPVLPCRPREALIQLDEGSVAGPVGAVGLGGVLPRQFTIPG